MQASVFFFGQLLVIQLAFIFELFILLSVAKIEGSIVAVDAQLIDFMEGWSI